MFWSPIRPRSNLLFLLCLSLHRFLIVDASSLSLDVFATVSPSSSGVVVVVSNSPAAEALSMSTSLPRPTEPPSVLSSQKDAPVVSSPTSRMPSTTESSRPPSSSSHSSPSVEPSTKASAPAATSTHAPAPPSPSKPAVPSTPASTSHSVSGTTSVAAVQAPLAPKTTAVTTQANTISSKALALTSTGSNGATFTTTPPLTTVMSVSTEPNGVANPNFNSGQQLTSNTGIHKPGVLAGVCVVAGIVAASLIVGIIFCIRRKQRLGRRRRWLAGMQQQQPTSSTGDPFRDPNDDTYQTDGSAMHSVGGSGEDVRWNRSNNSPVRQEPMTHEKRPSFGNGTMSIYPDPYPVFNSAAMGAHELQHVGAAYYTDLAIPTAPYRRHSLNPSTPSIYPVTLPPDEDDQHEAEDDTPPISPISLQEPMSIKPPPRPPRSHLRESAKIRQYAPLTPPDSVSAHTTSQPPSPISESRPQDIFTRRTLLDIRTRPIA